MASVTTNIPADVTYTLELNKVEAELLVALLGRTNSVHETDSDSIYHALVDAGVAIERFQVLARNEQVSCLTLKPRGH